jgi:hypothetical protein
MTRVYSLCPACDHCPTVEISESEVRIGEGANRVTLTPAEWDALVRAIKVGELDEIGAQA